MKKIIAVLTLIFAFTINANAQDVNPAHAVSAKKDVALLTEKIALTPAEEEKAYKTFLAKYKALEDATMTQASKEELYLKIENKLKSNLKEKARYFMKDPELLQKLTH